MPEKPVPEKPVPEKAMPEKAMPEKPLVLACAADDDFAMPMAAMLHSALVNLDPSRAVHLFVIDDGIRDDNKKRLQRTIYAARPQATLSWLEEAGRLPEGLKTSWCISTSAYLRLLLPDLLPDHYEKVMYLDSDVIVEADLQHLWNQEIPERTAVLAVQDFIVPYVSCAKGLALYEELGLAPDAPYFNSGVMVINLKRWRAERVSQKVFRYLDEHHEHVHLHDQDGLNAVLAGAWEKLSPRWNQQTDLFHFEWWDGDRKKFKERIRPLREDLVHRPHIIHFTGASKPWHPRCHHPEQGRFLRYLKESAWFTPLEWNAWRLGKALLRPERWLREKTRPARHWLRSAVAG
jgi:lipopolysaccharide biosynthesis glycosyltransferase